MDQRRDQDRGAHATFTKQRALPLYWLLHSPEPAPRERRPRRRPKRTFVIPRCSVATTHPSMGVIPWLIMRSITNYREAFRAYYQYFFCLGGPSETVNPAAEDFGGAALLRGALAAAIAGDYREAITATRRAMKRDANFGEAPFILGDLLFICGNRRAARAAWHSVEAPYVGYPNPPGPPSSETYAIAAREMLKRHS